LVGDLVLRLNPHRFKYRQEFPYGRFEKIFFLVGYFYFSFVGVAFVSRVLVVSLAYGEIFDFSSPSWVEVRLALARFLALFRVG